MTAHLGMVRPGSTIYIPFDTFAGSTGAPITITGLAVGDILIYRQGSVTQRASTTGFTLLDTDGIDFDGITGIHGFSIDLSSNATADFYTAGAQYWVVVSTITVDSQTVSFVAATFWIGYPDAILNTTIATLSSQTSFTLTAGPAEDDALNGCIIVIHDIASAVQLGYALISDYTGSTRTVTLAAGTTFTAAAGDNFACFRPALLPTVAGRTLDVTATGAAGIDWGNLENPTTAVNLSATNIDVDQVVASVSGAVASVTGNVGGNVTGSVGSVATGGITAASIASDAITAAKIADGAIDAATFAAGAITAAVIADGAIDAATLATGTITAAKFAANAIDAAALAADAVTEIQSGLSTLTAAGVRTAVGLASANLDTQLDALPTAAENADAVWDETLSGHLGAGSTGAALNGATAPTAAAVADAVWDEALSGHVGAGSTGEALGAAGGAGDPWITALPGAYSSGQAGYILGTNLNATVSGRASQTSLDTVAGYIDTEIATLTTRLGTPSDLGSGASVAANLADIEAQTDDIGSAGAGLTALASAANLATLAGYVDTEVAAIKAKTDNLPTDPADQSAVEAAITAATSGLALQASVDTLEASATAIEADTQDIQARLPAALVSGRIDASVGAMAANVMTAAAAAADLTTELQSGLATASALSTVSGLVDDLEGRLTSVRAGYLDNLSAGAVALQSSVDSLESGVTLTNAGIDAIFDRTDGVETGYTLRQAMRLIAAAAAGELAGAATTTITLRNISDTKVRITATVDSDGNRSAVVHDVS